MFSKKLLAIFLFCILLGAVLFAFRIPVLQSFSNFLIQQDEPQKADAMVVLSGDAFMRGNEGARLFQQGWTQKIFCPGGNLEPLFLIEGDSIYESDMCRKNIVSNGVADSLVIAIREGTSTAEEAIAILKYCETNKIKSLLIVSSLFHTRRAGNVYRKLFKPRGIKIFVRGAHSFYFDENHWWQSEYGLIALNNEYVKLLYYVIK